MGHPWFKTIGKCYFELKSLVKQIIEREWIYLRPEERIKLAGVNKIFEGLAALQAVLEQIEQRRYEVSRLSV